MKTILATAMLGATLLALPACSGKNGTETATTNETALSNDDFSSGQENPTATDDIATENAAIGNTSAADFINDSAPDATAGNAL